MLLLRLIKTALLTAALLPAAAMAHTWMTVKIATTEYAPYTSEEMEHNGYMNHIISEVFLETGVRAEFIYVPWEDALEGAKNGEYDAISYGNYVRDREKTFWHSEPVTSENLVFYVNNESGPDMWSGLNDLTDYTMGVTKDYLYNNELSRYIKEGKNISTADTDDENFNQLIDGDTDIFPIDELTGWYLLQRDFSEAERDEIHQISPLVSTVTTHLLVPKNKEKRLVLELFNRGLNNLKEKGELDRFKRLLREGYYQTPEKPVNFDRR